MTVITKNIPNTATSLDLGSFAAYRFLPIKIGCDINCGEECPDCGLDFAYIVRENDTVHLQFRYPDQRNVNPVNPTIGWDTGVGNFWLQASLMNGDGTVAIEHLTRPAGGVTNGVVQGYAVGYDMGSWQNLNINVNEALLASLNSECFYIRIKICLEAPIINILTVEGVFATLPAIGSYKTGDYVIAGNILYIATSTGWSAVASQPVNGTIIYSVADGTTWRKVDGAWVISAGGVPVANNCSNFRQCFSPVFRLDQCNEPLLCFESTPTGNTDCGGNYYGSEGVGQNYGTFQYQEQFCIVGDLEKVGNETVRETTRNGRVTKEENKSVYRMRTIVPATVAERIKNAMLPQGFTINGLTFDTYAPIQKDNDESADWHIDTELTAKDCDNVGACL